MNAFHAYDIRGIYNKDFNKDDVYKIGFFLPRLLQADKILVGRDVRISSPEIFKYLSQGIIDSGTDVYDIGLSTTPMVYWGTAKFGFKGSVMITASHNSKEYNGLKISREDALPVGFDNGLGDLKRMIEEEDVLPVSVKGSIIPLELKGRYIDFQRQYLEGITNLKIAIDCSNGMAGLLIKDILGLDPYYLYDEPDGNFPHHDPNPLVESNVTDLKNLVKSERCEIGIIFDGDADRVMFVDENGEFISPDIIIGLLAQYYLIEKGMKGNVLHDIRTSKAVGEYIEQLGSSVYMWKVGRAYAALKLREIDGIFGGELAGHYYIRDFYYSDSGILAALLVLIVVSQNKAFGKSLSHLIEEIRKYESSGEINFKLEHKQEAMDCVRDYFISQEEPTAYYDFDGYRVEYRDWWFNIRKSNTEPYLRLIIEARNISLLESKLEIIHKLLANFS